MKLSVLLLSVGIILLIFGCGNADSSNKDLKNITPDKWGEDVYALYEKSIVKLDELIGAKPEFTEDLKKKAADLKNTIINELVAYGKARSQMSETDQKLCTAKLSLRMGRIANNPAWIRTQNEALMFYTKINSDFGSLIASFNIITQYAQFELLKRQEPKEAARLGI